MIMIFLKDIRKKLKKNIFLLFFCYLIIEIILRRLKLIVKEFIKYLKYRDNDFSFTHY